MPVSKTLIEQCSLRTRINLIDDALMPGPHCNIPIADHDTYAFASDAGYAMPITPLRRKWPMLLAAESAVERVHVEATGGRTIDETRPNSARTPCGNASAMIHPSTRTPPYALRRESHRVNATMQGSGISNR